MKNAIKTIGKIMGITLVLIVVLVACKIVSFQPYTMKNIRMENGVVVSDLKIERENYSVIDVGIENREDVTEINNLTLVYNGEGVELSDSIYESKLRYYISVDDIRNNVNNEIEEDNNFIYNRGVKLIDKNLQSFYVNNNELKLRGDILRLNNKSYMCLNDLEHVMNLRIHWEFKENKIYVFNEKKDLSLKVAQNNNGKIALMRLEDVTAGGVFSNSENIEKFKIIGDFLYSQGIRFNIAWIPRYINYDNGVDNDLLRNKSIENVAFINMLDHLIYRGASIGLHGYTHQSGNTISAEGGELTYKNNNSEDDVIRIVENAVRAAKELKIPIDFFESPHYNATRSQQKILERYFNIMYEPYSGYWNIRPLVSLTNKSTLYVPAPLKRVKDENGQELCNSIINSNKCILRSFFIHPYKELNFIIFNNIDENGYLEYFYDENSIIHNVVNTLNKEDYITIQVNELLF